MFGERRAVSYSKKIREAAKKRNLKLATVDTPGFTAQCLGDQQLCDELTRAVMACRARLNPKD